MPNAESLSEQFAIPGVLAFDEPHAGMVRARIRTETCTAELYLHGAHLTAWQPAGTEPVIWLSPNAVFAREKAIRGGIPVIFPWFGARTVEITGATTEGPQHGFARTAEWQLQFAAQSGEDVHLALTLGPDEHTRALGFDHFRVALEFRLGRTLQVRMTVANEGSAPLTFEQALHSYFHVGEITRTTVQGLENTAYLDKTDGFRRKQQGSEPIAFSAEVDRPYLNTEAPATIDDAALSRRLRVSKAGSRTTVVWNPGPELAAKTVDLGADTFTNFVCVETANAAEDRVTLAPGTACTMEARIEVIA